MKSVDYQAQLNTRDKDQIWLEIHEKGKKEFSQRKRSLEAKRLESFLRDLKLFLSKHPSNSIGEFIGTEIMKKASPVSYEGRALFEYSSGRQGIEFEKDITQIFNEIMGENVVVNVGTQGATTGMVFDILDIENIYKNSNIDELLQRGVIKLVETSENKQLFTLGAKQGKIDVSAGKSSQVKLMATESKTLQEIRSIISGSNFSLKNYAGRTIHLGHTSLIRVYTAMLPKLMPQFTEEQIKFFYKKTTSGKQSATTALHKSHLRFMYELSGLGLICEGERTDLKAVDFLIINEKLGPNIYVYSVGDLIDNYLNSSTPKKTMSITVKTSDD